MHLISLHINMHGALYMYNMQVYDVYLKTVYLDCRPLWDDVHDPPFCFLGGYFLHVNGTNTRFIYFTLWGDFLVCFTWYMPKNDLWDAVKKTIENAVKNTSPAPYNFYVIEIDKKSFDIIVG